MMEMNKRWVKLNNSSNRKSPKRTSPKGTQGLFKKTQGTFKVGSGFTDK